MERRRLRRWRQWRTREIDEARICGSLSEDDDSEDDTSEAWVLSVDGKPHPNGC